MENIMTQFDVAASGSFELAGKRVHRLGFGTNRLADPDIWGPPADRDNSIRVARRAVEIGFDFIDTADSYGFGVTEEILAEALYPYPENLLIATKCGQVQTRPRQWVPLGRPEYLRQQCEASLRRLRVECIDLLQLHRVDPAVPLGDQVGELKLLQDEGKIVAVGLCEVTVEQIEAARQIVDIASVQSIYNLTVRNWDEVVEYCVRERIAFIPWFPIMGGALVTAEGMAETAAAAGMTAAQLSLAWLLARADVMLPIPGTSSIAHLEENARAAAIELSAEQFEALRKTPVAATMKI